MLVYYKALMVTTLRGTYFDQWSHKTSWQVKVGHIGHQTGVILDRRLSMTDVG